MEFPPDKQIILVGKFKENLEPLMCSNTEEVRKIRAGAKYVAESFGVVTTWVPLRMAIIGKHRVRSLSAADVTWGFWRPVSAFAAREGRTAGGAADEGGVTAQARCRSCEAARCGPEQTAEASL